jgi:hypothetical protein
MGPIPKRDTPYRVVDKGKFIPQTFAKFVESVVAVFK